MFLIRCARNEDLTRLLEIYDAARAFMRRTGNLHQWNGAYPSAEVLLEDIRKEQLYVMEVDEKIEAVFALIIGKDPTYSYIEGGAWISDEPYGTIHRIASSGSLRGVLQKAVDFSWERIQHLRVDTHEDNRVMREAIRKSGFVKCGIIYLLDGSPRLAYERIRGQAFDPDDR